MVTAAHEATLRLEGERIHVREVGEGPPVLLINGLGAHTAMWEALEGALDGFRVVSFDAPGTGRSSTPLVPMGVGRLARLAAQVLDHFEIERADVLGYSMGGIVTQQLCHDFPARVRRAVLVATSPGLGGVHGDALAMLNIATPARYLSPRLYMLTIGSLVGGKARTDREWIARHGAIRLRCRPSIRGYVNQLAGLTGWSGLPLLERIEHPVLVVTGDGDPLNPVANSLLIAHLLRDGRVLVVRDEGHLLLMDPEGDALPAIRDFLDAERLDPAADVSADEVRRALGEARWQLQPWGLLSARLRRRWFG